MEPNVELVKVYECGNAALVPLLKSVLDDADIEYMVKGEEIQDLIGAGRFGGSNYLIGPVEFWVREDAATEARAVLEAFGSPNELPAE
ncbi:MAG TPA: DUF2007 domain-containing protein [Thermoanaerobaculia bacterium]